MKQILKEETEAPFRQVRLFLYAALTASAVIGLIVSGSRLAAAASGIKNDDISELLANVGINAGGIAVISALWRNDLNSQKLRLQRIQKGGRLAGLKLKITTEDGPTVIKMSDLRRGRGYSKRVVVVVAPEALLKESVLSSISECQSLVNNDLLIVPVQIAGVETAEAMEASSYRVVPLQLESIVTEGSRADHIGIVSTKTLYCLPLYCTTHPTYIHIACRLGGLEHSAQERVGDGSFPAAGCVE
jgi:hypothetical protein